MEKQLLFGQLLYMGLRYYKGRGCMYSSLFRQKKRNNLRLHVKNMMDMIDCISEPGVTQRDYQVIHDFLALAKYYDIRQMYALDESALHDWLVDSSVLTSVEVAPKYQDVNKLLAFIMRDVYYLISTPLAFLHASKLFYLFLAAHNLPRVYMFATGTTFCEKLPGLLIAPEEAIEYALTLLKDDDRAKYVKECGMI